jgi:hypothetical protein
MVLNSGNVKNFYQNFVPMGLYYAANKNFVGCGGLYQTLNYHSRTLGIITDEIFKILIVNLMALK